MFSNLKYDPACFPNNLAYKIAPLKMRIIGFIAAAAIQPVDS